MKINVKVFFALMPFIYAVQVLCMRKDIVAIPYLLVILCIIPLTLQDNNPRQSGALLDEIAMLFSLTALVWAVFEGVVYGVVSGVRVLFLFFVPTIIYFVIARGCKGRDIGQLMSIISISSLVVATELLFEIAHSKILLQPSLFQEQNFAYVASMGSGRELYQLLLIEYRPPGIIEHLHATATYIAIGLIASLGLYLMSGRKPLVVIIGIDLIALVFSGSRLVQIATLVALICVGLTVRVGCEREYWKRFSRGGVAGGIMLGSVMAYVGWNWGEAAQAFVREYYLPVFSSLDFFQGRSFLLDILLPSMRNWLGAFGTYPGAILFGFGPTTLLYDVNAASDDVFVLQIFGQYGLAGGIAFYSFLIVAMREWGTEVKTLRGPSRVVCIFAGAAAILLYLTTVHSGALQRKAIYPLLFLAIGIIRRYAVRPIRGIDSQFIREIGMGVKRWRLSGRVR